MNMECCSEPCALVDAVPVGKKTHILFVGEGDFSFSAHYITTLKNCNEIIYASCLSDGFLTEAQQRNTEIVKQNGGFVYTDVDATCLESHPKVGDLKFSKIVFNFPHIPGKMNICKNRQLVEQFFLSAVKILEDSGTILVTLCQGQGGTEIEKVKRKWCDTWQIVSLAASASLVLYNIKAFDGDFFRTYRCTGFRGREKPFNIKGALTHIFKYCPPVNLNMKLKNNPLDIDLYFQDCETLYRNIYRNLCQPTFKVLRILNNIAMKVFESVYQEDIGDLLLCKSLYSQNSNLNFDDLCESCLKNLFFQYLNKKGSGIISVTCTICCSKIINVNKNPFYHLISYFSNDNEYLIKKLPKFLEKIKQLYNLNKINNFDTENSYLINNKCIQTVICDTKKSVKKEFTIKNVLNVYAKYSLNHGDELFFYSDVDIFLNNAPDKMETDTNFKIGTVFQFGYNFGYYTGILFNLDKLALLKYHIMDYRILLSESSFYSSKKIWDYHVEIYRPFSLFAPTYEHDISFYVGEDFCEKDFFLIVRNITGNLIKSIALLDVYYDQKLHKHSRCYRFRYQSYNQALSKENAGEIHTNFVRKALANSLNVLLR